MIPRYYPPVGFHFVVSITQSVKGNLKTAAKEMTLDSQFQSVSGLSVDITTEEYAEGGENRFKHKLPLKTTYPNLVLKRGLILGSELTDWCKNAIENFEFELKDITVMLLDSTHSPLMTWEVVGAMPVKWAVDEFSAMESKIVVESIELSYKYFTIKNPTNYGN